MEFWIPLISGSWTKNRMFCCRACFCKWINSNDIEKYRSNVRTSRGYWLVHSYYQATTTEQKVHWHIWMQLVKKKGITPYVLPLGVVRPHALGLEMLIKPPLHFCTFCFVSGLSLLLYQAVSFTAAFIRISIFLTAAIFIDILSTPGCKVLIVHPTNFPCYF